MTSTDVATREEWSLFASQSEQSFAELVSQDADFIRGHRLVEKTELIGKPFVIRRVKFNPGLGADFVSIEAVTKDDEMVVFNDGSTGVRRQLVHYLTMKGLVDPGNPPKDAAGNVGDPGDNPYSLWKKGADIAHDGFDVKLVATQGLRVSDYEWNDQPARTFYLS